jgi:hypothetical protein
MNHPVVNKVVAVDTVEVGELKLADLIREEILSSKQTLEYSDDDIKEVSVLNGGSTTDLRVLLHSEFEDWKSFLHGVNNNLVLMVILDFLMAPKRSISSLFDRRMKPSQPTLTYLTPAMSAANVVSFLKQLQAATNRDTFLKSYPGRKPSVYEQVESFIIQTLTANNLGFYERIDMNEKIVVEKSLARTVQVFVEVQKYRSRLSVR